MILVKYNALRYLRHIAGTSIKSWPLTGRTFLLCIGSSVWFCRFTTTKPTGVLWKGLNVLVWVVGKGYTCVALDQFQRAVLLSDEITLWATATKKTGMFSISLLKRIDNKWIGIKLERSLFNFLLLIFILLLPAGPTKMPAIWWSWRISGKIAGSDPMVREVREQEQRAPTA